MYDWMCKRIRDPVVDVRSWIARSGGAGTDSIAGGLNMTVFTDEQARQQLDQVFREAKATGEVRIRTGDGQEFVLRPAATGRSPLSVPGVSGKVSLDQIVDAVRE